MMPKVLRMKATIYMKMEDGETREQAEDRLVDTIDDIDGMSVYAWESVEVITSARKNVTVEEVAVQGEAKTLKW